ncbi:MAG TPA: hypothetical protein VMS43_08315 [Allosphingosinicella sp.]|nr:hypothetical protein [Allosphingosinicella sp.]
MLKRILIPAALLLLAAPAVAQEAAERPLDPNCPREGDNRPTGIAWLCNGQLTRNYAFAFVYPAAAQRIPALKEILAAQAEEDRARLAQEAAAFGDAPQPFSYDAEWRLDAVTPELAAASAAISTYSGGAHGGIEYRVILIDRREDRRIRLVDLFAPNLFENSLFGRRIRGIRAVQDSFCRALTAQIRARREEPLAKITCPDIEEQPVTFLCGPRGRIEAMRAMLNPYVAGSWAEGSYEVDFPLDARMIGNMKRRYRVAFGPPGERRGRPRPCPVAL